MAQYQSFPDATGDSRTLEKLKALKLPDLAGRDFLDVGCNEGFFCGFAKFAGAQRSVGIDRSAAFIARARQRFPACDILERDWNRLPEGPFDVVLLASALHYADDQAALVHRLVDLLAPDGTVYNLHNRTGGSADGIDTTYTVNLSGEALNGAWKLRAVDRGRRDTGNINSWSITF